MTTLAVSTGGGMASMLRALCSGGSVVALSDANGQALPYIDLYRVDTLATTPAVAQMMLDIPKVGQYLASLRDVRFGGALASPELIAEFARLTPARLHVGYGASEVGSCFRAVYDPAQPKAEGFVGQFFRNDLEIGFFDEKRNLLPGAVEGIVGFRPKDGSSGRGYLTAESDETAGFYDGWFFPGDLMRREGEDYFLQARMKNIVNVGGNKFSLEDIRVQIERGHPGSILIPVMETDARGIERLAVAYRSEAEISAEGLSTLLAARFRGLTVGRVLRMTDIPLTPGGKVDMQAVKAMFSRA